MVDVIECCLLKADQEPCFLVLSLSQYTYETKQLEQRHSHKDRIQNFQLALYSRQYLYNSLYWTSVMQTRFYSAYLEKDMEH